MGVEDWAEGVREEVDWEAEVKEEGDLGVADLENHMNEWHSSSSTRQNIYSLQIQPQITYITIYRSHSRHRKAAGAKACERDSLYQYTCNAYLGVVMGAGDWGEVGREEGG